MRALRFWSVIGVVTLIVSGTPAAPRVNAQWRQAVPFGPISALAGWTDISAASGLVDDVRFSRWHGSDPSPLIRVSRRDGQLKAEALLWFPNMALHPSHYPSGPDVTCDSRQEPPRTCIKPVAIPSTVVLPDIAALLGIPSCRTPPRSGADGARIPPVAHPTHTLTLQMQMVGAQTVFRTYECVGADSETGPGAPLAVRLLKILDEVGLAAGYR